jgi:hypothetical protein
MKPIPFLPPGPYGFETTARPGQPDGSGHVYITDASGRRIATVWGDADEKLAFVELIRRADRAYRRQVTSEAAGA